jgi:hypothetical protein
LPLIWPPAFFWFVSGLLVWIGCGNQLNLRYGLAFILGGGTAVAQIVLASFSMYSLENASDPVLHFASNILLQLASTPLLVFWYPSQLARFLHIISFLLSAIEPWNVDREGHSEAITANELSIIMIFEIDWSYLVWSA